MKKIAAILLLIVTLAVSQEANYDESLVPDYTLPELFKMQDGTLVKTVKDWEQKRRPEILALFEKEVYGKSPEAPKNLRYKVLEQSDKAIDGKATRKQVRVFFSDNENPHMDILIYIPNKVSKPAPGFLTLNFYGNHTVSNDPEIIISDSWSRNNEDFHIENNKLDERSRGVRTNRWAVEKIIDRGYMLSTIYYGDIDPDFNDFNNGIHPLFYKNDQTQPGPDEWGAIAAWAWGLSRAMDYFEKDNQIDQNNIAVMGHSRLGKTSLWAGATDPRIAITISNCSGCGGAAISRRKFGETVKRINTSFPHWFCDNFLQYNDNEDNLPIDQHMLIALMAPRPVYIASAEKDRWADPKGEFLSGKFASPVFELYGFEAMQADEWPPVNTPVKGIIGYHVRTGKHDVTEYDWEQYLEFADKYLKN